MSDRCSACWPTNVFLTDVAPELRELLNAVKFHQYIRSISFGHGLVLRVASLVLSGSAFGWCNSIRV